MFGGNPGPTIGLTSPHHDVFQNEARPIKTIQELTFIATYRNSPSIEVTLRSALESFMITEDFGGLIGPLDQDDSEDCDEDQSRAEVSARFEIKPDSYDGKRTSHWQSSVNPESGDLNEYGKT